MCRVYQFAVRCTFAIANLQQSRPAYAQGQVRLPQLIRLSARRDECTRPHFIALEHSSMAQYRQTQPDLLYTSGLLRNTRIQHSYGEDTSRTRREPRWQKCYHQGRRSCSARASCKETQVDSQRERAIRQAPHQERQCCRFERCFRAELRRRGQGKAQVICGGETAFAVCQLQQYVRRSFVSLSY